MALESAFAATGLRPPVGDLLIPGSAALP
jgi:hypothetical protein